MIFGEFLFYKPVIDPFFKKLTSHNTYCIRKAKIEAYQKEIKALKEKYKDKIELISDICNASTDDNHYINYVRVNIYAQVYTYLAYTNITVTDKQKEDIFKLYDMFAGGLGDELQKVIPHAELDFINSNVVNIMEGIYKYQNSAMGLVEAISNDYSNLDFDATELQRKIGDPDNLTLLKNIMTKLG